MHKKLNVLLECCAGWEWRFIAALQIKQNQSNARHDGVTQQAYLRAAKCIHHHINTTAIGLLPPLIKRLCAEAPGVVLVIRRINYLLIPALLTSGEISVGVAYAEELSANAKRKVLRRSKPKLLRADTAPGPLKCSASVKPSTRPRPT